MTTEELKAALESALARIEVLEEKTQGISFKLDPNVPRRGGNATMGPGKGHLDAPDGKLVFMHPRDPNLNAQFDWQTLSFTRVERIPPKALEE